MGWMRGLRRPVLVGLSCERLDDNFASYVGLGRLGRTLSSLYMRRIYLPQFDHRVANSPYTAGDYDGRPAIIRAAFACSRSASMSSASAPIGDRTRASGAARSPRATKIRASSCTPGAALERTLTSCQLFCESSSCMDAGLPPGHRRLWTARGRARRRMRGGGSWPSHFSSAPEP